MIFLLNINYIKFINNQEKFTTRSNKLKLHRANSQAISPHPVRFSTDILFSSLVSFAFLVFLFFWNWKHLFSYTFDYVGGWVIIFFNWPISCNKSSFFLALLKKTISIFSVWSFTIPFLILSCFQSFSVAFSYCRLSISRVTTMWYIAHSLLTCWIGYGFTWKVFLSKFTSVLLTEVKSLAIISSLMALLRKHLISIPLLVLTFAIPLNKLYFSVEKQTPWYILSSSRTEKLKYFLFLSLESFNEERYPNKEIKNKKFSSK